jgi:hypothetical protein
VWSLNRWRFASTSGRDLRLDLLRGWCIFSMVVDHAAGERTTPLFVLTGNGGWPMTGAHGFVLISGAIMGFYVSSTSAGSAATLQASVGLATRPAKPTRTSKHSSGLLRCSRLLDFSCRRVNGELMRWCLGQGLRITTQGTLMTIGLYNEPVGADLPSISLLITTGRGPISPPAGLVRDS